MIRRAAVEDLETVVERVAAFHAYSTWADIPLDRPAVEALADKLLAGGVVFLSETGLIGGLMAPLWLAPTLQVGLELFWYAPDGHGQALRMAFEDWAREQGAFGLQFSAMADGHLPALSRIYRRAGYAPVETAFMKRF